MTFQGIVKRSIFYAKDYFNGQPILRPYREIGKTLGQYDMGHYKQASDLKNFLEYASQNTAFYRELTGCDLASFPVVNKNVLIKSRSLLEIEPGVVPAQNQHPFYLQRTSGSTGTPFEVPHSALKRQRRVAEIKWFSANAGYQSHERLGVVRVWTRWQGRSARQSWLEQIWPINATDMSPKSLQQICGFIEEKRLTALRGYASWFTAFADYLENNPLEIRRVKSIATCISISESLEESTRNKLESLLNSVVVECYANEENGILGQQTIDSRSFQLNHSGYVFEFLRLDSDEAAEPGELARIVLTDLNSFAFPMIRYDTGDTGVYRDIDGSWPVLDRLYGRRMDLITSANGDPIHPMTFGRVLKNLSGLRQWQFVQVGDTEYVLRVVTDEGFDETECRQFLLEILGPEASLEFEIVDAVPVLASGKRRPVVREF